MAGAWTQSHLCSSESESPGHPPHSPPQRAHSPKGPTVSQQRATSWKHNPYRSCLCFFNLQDVKEPTTSSLTATADSPHSLCLLKQMDFPFQTVGQSETLLLNVLAKQLQPSNNHTATERWSHCWLTRDVSKYGTVWSCGLGKS